MYWSTGPLPEHPHHSGSGGSGITDDGSQQSKEKAKVGKAEKTLKDKKQIQTSPVPVRKNARDEEKRESRIKTYSPFAFKFYMEQHIENVMKTYQQKLNRRLQLEQEMSKVMGHPNPFNSIFDKTITLMALSPQVRFVRNRP